MTVLIPHERGTWLDPATGATVPQGSLLDRVASAEAVLLGETHDIAEIHRWQLHVTAALHQRQPDLAVGFEMFPRRVQPVLDEWVGGTLGTERFLGKVGWNEVWGFDPELYLPLFHFCRQQRVRMLALNCERSLVRRVRLEGWDAIPASERDGLSPAKPATDAYRRYLSGLMSGMAGAPVREISDGFVNAQQVWDRAFACNIARALLAGEAPLVVGIIGRGHLEFGHGTPYQLRDLGIQRLSVLLPTGPDGDARDLRPGIAEAVFRLDRPEERAARHFKLGAVWQGRAPVIAAIADESPAREIGLIAGDRILAVAGADIADVDSVNALLRRALPGCLVPLTVERQGTRIEILLPVPRPKPFGQ